MFCGLALGERSQAEVLRVAQASLVLELELVLEQALQLASEK